MKKHEFKPGGFYFHTKCHYLFFADENNNLINLESGHLLLDENDPRVKNNYFKFLRPALQSEILRVLEKNANFRRTSLNQVIDFEGVISRCCRAKVKEESLKSKNYQCSRCNVSCGIV